MLPKNFLPNQTSLKSGPYKTDLRICAILVQIGIFHCKKHVEAMQATVETDKVIKFSNDIHYVVEGVGKLGL